MSEKPCREDEAYAAGRLAGFLEGLEAPRDYPVPDGPELRRDGPVVLIQADADPGDMGEPREWVGDGVTYLVVPSFELWAERNE